MTVQPGVGHGLPKGLKCRAVIGRLSVASSVQLVKWSGKNTLIELLQDLPLSVSLVRFSVKAEGFLIYEAGHNLRDLPELNEEARGCFVAPQGF